MKKFSSLVVVAVVTTLAALSGCAYFGLATPKTPTQDLAYAVSVHEGLAKGLNNAVITGAISPTDAQAIESYLIQSSVGLRATRISLDGCVVHGQPVATVQGVVFTQAPGPISTVAALALQTITCRSGTTAIDQLVLVNSLLQQLSTYYVTRGIKTN